MAPTLRERAPPGTSALPSLPNPSSSSGAASAGESSTTARETAGRIRSNSLQQALEVVPTTFGAAAELEESDEVLNRARDGAVEEGTSSKKLATLERTGTALPEVKHVEMAESTEEVTGRPTFLSDLVTFRWMSSIRSSLTLILLILAAYGLLEIFPSLSPLGVIPVPSYTPHLPHPENPLAHLLFISYPLPHTSATVGGAQLYSKGRLDIAFLGFYIIVFSFLRLVVTRFLVRPLALALGLGKGGGKGAEGLLLRFMEQGYAFVYFFCSSALGLYVMSGQDTWWYQTEFYWINYPHWKMTGALKSYYLLQFAYWCQQMLVLVLRIEKPRSDFYELIVHHLVTLWLVGWSYTLNLTLIGTAIFVSMDVPDVCLAMSKCLNYLEYQRISEASFVFFLIVWHYMRHYLNLKILYSVYYEFPLHIPLSMMSWEHPTHPGRWWLPFGITSGVLPSWIQEQIFLPIALLQGVNLFWSYLIWRVLFRMIKGTGLVDVREEGEEGAIQAKPIAEKKKSR